MKKILKWVYPEGAAIIDAMLFSQPVTQKDDALILHKRYLESIHDNIVAPRIIYPHWHLFMRDDGKPFMVAYPFGLSNKQPYNVRVLCDVYSYLKQHESYYKTAIDIRYNLSATGHKAYYQLVMNQYENVVDYVSLAASAQATFHSIFTEQSRNSVYWNDYDFVDNIGEYSSQPTILPYYQTHSKGKKHERQ